MESTHHISFETLTHPDAEADFKSLAPTRRVRKQNLAIAEDLWRCTNCASPGTNDGLKVCSGCKLTRYCSRKCQVADWSDHKQNCQLPNKTMTTGKTVVNDHDETVSDKHPELAIKLAQRITAVDYLMHIFQLYAILAMDLLNNPSAVATKMIQVTVTTTPADIMGYLQATTSGQDISKVQLMLDIPKIEVVPHNMTPAMRRGLDEVRRSHPTSAVVVPFMFRNIMNNVFFVPQVLTSGALLDARAKPKIEVKSKLSGVSQLPFNTTHLRETIVSFIRMDKKNQTKLRATPK